MFWLFLAAITVCVGFFRLGALSVWVSALTATVAILLVALVALGGFNIWLRYRTPTKP